MSSIMIALVGIAYAAISVEQFARDNPGMGIVFAGYSFSNVGLWLQTK